MSCFCVENVITVKYFWLQLIEEPNIVHLTLREYLDVFIHLQGEAVNAFQAIGGVGHYQHL